MRTFLMLGWMLGMAAAVAVDMDCEWDSQVVCRAVQECETDSDCEDVSAVGELVRIVAAAKKEVL